VSAAFSAVSDEQAERARAAAAMVTANMVFMDILPRKKVEADGTDECPTAQHFGDSISTGYKWCKRQQHPVVKIG
jgi:hypothetical protein